MAPSNDLGRPSATGIWALGAWRVTVLTCAVCMIGSVHRAHATGVVGSGPPASCSEATLDAALAGGGSVTFNCGASPVTITVTSTKAIAANASIDGSGLITLSGGGTVRLFVVNEGVTLHLDSVTISAGSDGAIFNDDGTLTVTNSTFSGNNANGGSYGAIYNNGGTLTVTNSTFSGNSGGSGSVGSVIGIGVGGGTLTVTNSTFTGNSGSDAIWNGGTVNVTTSTFSGNSAGGIENDGELTVSNSTFSGNSASAGGGISNDSGTLTVTNSTFSGNKASAGGGIYNNGGNGGTLTVIDSIFSGNSSTAGFGAGGGGIYNDDGGILTVSNSSFSGNSAADYGGGIFNGGTLTVTNSAFSGNSGIAGGAISNGLYGRETLNVTNSTFSGNDAIGVGGGGIYNGGTLTVTNSTFSGNSGVSAIYNSICAAGAVPCPATLRNTLVANSTPGGNCAGTITDGGHNLDSDGTCGVGRATDPLLNPVGLANNGGPTQTIALQAGSPAINAGDESVCAAAPVNNLDQRGFVRPGTGHTQCSIGAYEADAIAPALCIGNCNNDSSVTVDELLTMVSIALGEADISSCSAGIAAGVTQITVDQILTAVSNALNGCGGG